MNTGRSDNIMPPAHSNTDTVEMEEVKNRHCIHRHPLSGEVENHMMDPIEEAMEEIDSAISKYYYLAKETVPDLVLTESAPYKFLLTEQGNITKAAQRLANYWMSRAFFFEDRWLLPMTQTGSGCLSREDIEVLRCGCLAMVTMPDQRQIFISDPSLMKRKVAAAVRERVLFYLATVQLTDVTLREGLTVVYVLSIDGFANVNAERAVELYGKYVNSVPVVLKSMVIVSYPYPAGIESLREYHRSLIAYSHQVFYPQITVAAPESAEQALRVLEDGGVRRIFLPEKLGGHANFEQQLSDWVRMRLSVEDAMSAALPLRNLLPTVAMSKPDRSNKGLTTIIRKSAKHGLTSQEDFVKMRNSMYARRKAHKAKLQKVVLQDEKELLEEENRQLKQENKNLEHLLTLAK